jgi:transposase
MPNRKTSRGRPHKFPREFRQDAVDMVLNEERSVSDVARTIGVNAGTLGRWVADERLARAGRAGFTIAEREELARLRAENEELRMQRDLLKRSLAFWIKDTSAP